MPEKKKPSKSRREKSVYNPPPEPKRVAKKKKPTVHSTRIMCPICTFEIEFLEEADDTIDGYVHHDCRIDDIKRKKRAATIARRIADVDPTVLG